MQAKVQEKRDFFISRAGADSEWAQWIAHELEAAEYTTLVQDWDSRPGKSFVEFMQRGAECETTILVVTAAYWEAVFTQPEWRAAFVQESLIPVLIERCEIPALLKQYVYIDLVGAEEEEARRRLLEGVKAGRAKNPVEFPGKAGGMRVSVAKLPTVNPLLVGREAELTKLDEAWEDSSVRLVSIVAFGGVGKTSLAVNWWHQNQARGAKRILGWSFYSQGAGDDRQASADPFLDYALREWFGVADPPKDSWARGERLAELIRRERTLLILDGLEPLQFPPGEMGGRLKDPGMVALLKELAAHSPGLCVCTSRLPLVDLEDYGNAGVVAIDLDNLTPATGAEYLRALQVEGSQEELEKASEEFGNHALALTLLGNYVQRRLGGDIRKRDTIPDLFSAPGKGGHARRVFRAYEALFRDKPELVVLRTLGLFDRPADKEALRILRTMPLTEWTEAVENLRDARLLFEYDDPEGPLDCHPLVREHLAEEYRGADPEGFREAHGRLYEHYKEQAPHQPDTLEEMQPLFYAVYHGCQAGKHEEVCGDVYVERIQRGAPEFYLLHQVGAFGLDLSLLANFFAVPWRIPAAVLTADYQSWILGQAAFSLRAVGRLREALEPSRAGAEGHVARVSWTNAAIGFSNLSELQLTIGNIGDAVTAARQSVDAADRSEQAFHRMARRTTLAAALHLSGDVDGAARLFAEAETAQRKWKPEYPMLYSLRGYWYCDLLLGERRGDEVVRRATQTLAWAEANGLPIDIALDHLSLGSAFAAGSDEAGEHLNDAVGGIRRAGRLDMLSHALLARAGHFRFTKEFEKAQHDLDEVRILASRCGMRLHLTDYHLEQARLLLAQEKKEEARPHLEAGRKLVEETGYHRRDSEVAELAGVLG